MALPTPPAYTNPIPNNPFYSIPTYLTNPNYPLIVGSGLSINPATSVISSTGGGGGGAVSSVTGGAGIVVSPNTGNVVVTNSGVTSLIAGPGVTISANTGAITISAPGGGSVTSITAGTGLTGGTITTSGTINLANTTVTAGSYTAANITVDAQGRITLASNGTVVSSVTGTLPVSVTAGSTPVVSVAAATTLASGVVQLSDSTSSPSSSTAATSLAVKTAFDVATAAIPKACITNKGALVTGTAASVPIALPAGADGLVLTTDSTCTEGLKWASGAAPVPATPTVEGIVFGCTDSATNFNTALGYNALLAPTALGIANVAIGSSAGNAITDGYGNTLVGPGAGCAITTATTNIGVGIGAISGVTTGNSNVGVGICAGCVYTNETGNVVLGGYYGDVGDTNALILSDSGFSGLKAKFNGVGALSLDGTNYGAAGEVLTSNGPAAKPSWQAAGGVTNATPTTAGLVFGYVGASLKTDSNAGIGLNALLNAAPIVTASNAAFGTRALQSLNLGGGNTALGWASLESTATGNGNTAVGAGAGSNADGTGNTMVGQSAGDNVIGNSNAFFGTGAAQSQASGDNNVAIGPDTALANTTGSCQLAIGFSGTENWLTGDSTQAIKPGAGIIDCTNSCGTANLVLTSQGNAVEWKSVSSALAVPNYGSFNSTATQTVTTLNTGKAVTLSTVATSNFSLVGGTQITAAVAGTYNVQISLQIISTAAGGGIVEVWFVKNGVAITNSNTRYSVKNANEEEVAALNLVETFAAGDNIQVFWASDNINMTLATLVSTMGGPAIPSAIVTVVPVGA
jgi:hypothetical protein